MGVGLVRALGRKGVPTTSGHPKISRHIDVFLNTYALQDIPSRHINMVFTTYRYVLEVCVDMFLKTYIRAYMSCRYVVKITPYVCLEDMS